MAHPKKSEVVPSTLPDIETIEGRREVIKRASSGDSSVRPLVSQLLARDQRLGGTLLEMYGDSFRHAYLELTKSVAGNDLMIQESLQHKIRAVCDDLAGPSPTPLERILCERVALCWFDAFEADRRYGVQAGLSYKEAEFRENRRDRAHKR